MNWINIFLSTILVLFSSMAVLYGIYVLELSEYEKGLKGIIYYGIPALLTAGALVLGNPTVKKVLLFGFYLFFSIELLFQATAYFGILPSVHTYTHVPYGRVYYTKEGFANDHMNRFGWHVPDYRLAPKHRRLALIGDSFVLGIGVSSEENAGAILDRRFISADSTDTTSAVLTFGKSNIGPAHYFELLKYSWRHFKPDEAIIVLFLGNDFANMMRSDQSRGGHEHRFYGLRSGGGIELLPGSARILKDFIQPFDFNHKHIIYMLPLIVRSHIMIGEVIGEVRDGIKEFNEPEGLRYKSHTIENEFKNLGLQASVFQRNASDKVKRTALLVNLLFKEMQHYARDRGVVLRVVTIPFFPPSFYEINTSSDWNTVIGDYDLLKPDRSLKTFMQEQAIPFLSLADEFQKDNLSLEMVREMYFNGTGHFNQKGHQYLSDKTWEAFYDQVKH